MKSNVKTASRQLLRKETKIKIDGQQDKLTHNVNLNSVIIMNSFIFIF